MFSWSGSLPPIGKISEYPYNFKYVTNVNKQMLHLETKYLLHL